MLNRYLDQLERVEPAVPAQRRLLAALGPHKVRLARDRCAGAILLLVTPQYVRAARQILGEQPALVIDQMLVAVLAEASQPGAAEVARHLAGPLRSLAP